MRTKKLRVGTTLYHGTNVAEDFDVPYGPAWFSEHEGVAQYFSTYHGEEESRPRVLTYRVTTPPRLALIEDKRQLDDLMEEIGVGGDLDPEEFHVLPAFGYDGWIIPDNYHPGADIMIVHPEQFLEVVGVKEVSANPGPEDWKERFRISRDGGSSWERLPPDASIYLSHADRAKVFLGEVVRDGDWLIRLATAEERGTSTNPPATPTILSRQYYHGTSISRNGESILKDGLIIPPTTKRRGFTAPRPGFVYMTPSLYTSAIYALGGVWMGHEFPEQYLDKGRYGYIFAVHGGDLVDVEPDEDDVGEMATSKYDKRDAPGWLKRAAYDFAMRSPASNEKYRRAIGGELAYQSYFGKQLLKRMRNDQKLELMDAYPVNIANSAPVGFDAAWRLDKLRSKEVAEDGANLFDVAERIK